MKLINQDVVIDDINGLLSECNPDQDNVVSKAMELGMQGGLKVILEIIKNYPTFEIENAYWIKGEKYECSFCHYKQQDMTTYCPKCGSTMDGWYHG